MLAYDRHIPEKTPYYQTLARSWPGVVRDFNAADEKISGHVVSEFNRYFKCGILQHGFVWLKCNKCEDERIVAYSCKTRGLCFSCNARRMEQTAIRIDEEVWPNAPARQWVLSFPFQVRYWLARNPELLGAVNKAVCREISYFYEDTVAARFRGTDRCIADPSSDLGTGAISFVQFFGSALNLTPHLHIIFLDGGFTRAGGGKFDFTAVRGFNAEAMFGVIHGIINRLDLLFRDFGYVRDDGEGQEPELLEDVPLPFKPRAPKAFRRRKTREGDS
jgi:hypothetical protein